MDFDALRAAVVPGAGVVGRWPGVVCVAECADRHVLRRLLDVCAGSAGAEPGRTLARRLAMWLGGPDAPGDGLRFGTVAVTGAEARPGGQRGEQWAVFLYGAVGLVVPDRQVALSGAQSVAWTDRLLPRPDAPVVLALEGGPIPPGVVDGVHDLRIGVVPGAGAVLVPAGERASVDAAEDRGRADDARWPDSGGPDRRWGAEQAAVPPADGLFPGDGPGGGPGNGVPPRGDIGPLDGGFRGYDPGAGPERPTGRPHLRPVPSGTNGVAHRGWVPRRGSAVDLGRSPDADEGRAAGPAEDDPADRLADRSGERSDERRSPTRDELRGPEGATPGIGEERVPDATHPGAPNGARANGTTGTRGAGTNGATNGVGHDLLGGPPEVPAAEPERSPWSDGRGRDAGRPDRIEGWFATPDAGGTEAGLPAVGPADLRKPRHGRPDHHDDALADGDRADHERADGGSGQDGSADEGRTDEERGDEGRGDEGRGDDGRGGAELRTGNRDRDRASEERGAPPGGELGPAGSGDFGRDPGTFGPGDYGPATGGEFGADAGSEFGRDGGGAYGGAAGGEFPGSPGEFRGSAGEYGGAAGGDFGAAGGDEYRGAVSGEYLRDVGGEYLRDAGGEFSGAPGGDFGPAAAGDHLAAGGDRGPDSAGFGSGSGAGPVADTRSGAPAGLGPAAGDDLEGASDGTPRLGVPAQEAPPEPDRAHPLAPDAGGGDRESPHTTVLRADRILGAPGEPGPAALDDGPVTGGLVVEEQSGPPGPRPPLGLLVFDDGATYTVDAEYLMGRMPEADPRVATGALRALALEDGSGAVSRVHAQIVIDGWDALLVDAGSRNGTFVSPPGEQGWTQLPAGESHRLVPGTRVRIGGRSFLFEPPSAAHGP